jgi:hypothetical protein
MLSIASLVLLEPILDGQLSGQASNPMLFGPNGYTEHILVPLGFELSLLQELVKFIHFFCHRFGLDWSNCGLPSTILGFLARSHI